MVGRVLTASLHYFGVALFYLGAGPLIRRLGRKNPKILLYHDCADHESGYTAELECTTGAERFREHMAYLNRHYRFVDVETIASRGAPERSVAVTFDDGYSSVYQNAFPTLKAYGIPATIYLISSVIGNRTLVWVNELNALLREGGRAAAECARRHFGPRCPVEPAEIISFCRINYEPDKMDRLLAELRVLLDRPVQDHAAQARLYLTWDQIHEMRRAGISFGNHSRSHPNMARLSEDQQVEEITAAQRELQEQLPEVKAFAHPFGHMGRTTARLAAEANLGSVVEVGGTNRPVLPLALGRTHLSNESIAGLFARMEIVEPLKGLVRRRAATLRRGSAAV